MVRHDARDVDIEFSGLIAGEEIVQTVVHLRHEESHTWTYIAEIEAELHVVTLGIEGTDILFQFVGRNEEILEGPFHTHEEMFLDMVDILIEIDDVTIIVGYELRDLCDDSLLVGAVEQ